MGISLAVSDAELLCLYPVAICVSSLGKCLFRSFARFFLLDYLYIFCY